MNLSKRRLTAALNKLPLTQASGQLSRFYTLLDVQLAKSDPSLYWGTEARRVHFSKHPDRIAPLPRDEGQWFSGGELNICHNAVDRHVMGGMSDRPLRETKAAILYDNPVLGIKRTIAYKELHEQVLAVSHVLVNVFGVKCGDCVLIYMPNMPEAIFTMLACARIGAPHSVVFGGFASSELSKRIADSGAKVIVTTSCGTDGPFKVINYKALVDEAIDHLPNPSQVEHVGIFVRRPLQTISTRSPRDHLMEDLVRQSLSLPASSCPPCAAVPSSHPFYLLYTSGTTGIPKGITRDTGGTCVALASAIEKVFGIGPDDVIFTASDIGWIVGTNFSVYAPLINGSTSVLYEGKPVGTPDAGAFFRVLHEYRVNALFTAPTAIRAVKAVDPEGSFAMKYSSMRDTLRTVFLAGERTDPDTHQWLERLLGVPVVDNWWQTETGTPISAAPAVPAGNGLKLWTKPGSAGLPCPGWNVEAISSTTPAAAVGHDDGCSEIFIKLPLPPGALMSLWGRPNGVQDTYLSRRPNYFATFDAGHVDPDGFVHVLSRTDDVINTAGHRLSTGQMEEVLASHEDVAEAAVFGADCKLKGEVPVAAVVVKIGRSVDPASLEKLVRSKIGPIAVIRVHIVSKLPKTRSGKILRKSLRSIVNKRFPVQVPPTVEDASVIHDVWQQVHKEPYPEQPPAAAS